MIVVNEDYALTKTENHNNSFTTKASTTETDIKASDKKV